MKLRNKKTGAIYSIEDIDLGNNADGIWIGITKYNSLAELNEEWEDYDDTKDHWCISFCGEARQIGSYADREEIAECKQIGNYFETEEEAEKAVEKLKAWKRLKDKGFKVDLWDYDGGNYQERIKTGKILFRVKDYEENDKDLDLLFGGEDGE